MTSPITRSLAIHDPQIEALALQLGSTRRVFETGIQLLAIACALESTTMPEARKFLSYVTREAGDKFLLDHWDAIRRAYSRLETLPK